MKSVVVSPAVRYRAPDHPLIQIDSHATVEGLILTDCLGNTFTCQPGTEIWTNGLGATTIHHEVEFPEIFSLSLEYIPNAESGTIFNIGEVWKLGFEHGEGIFSVGEEPICLFEYTDTIKFGVTYNTQVIIYIDGEPYTEGVTVDYPGTVDLQLLALNSDRLVNFYLYDSVLTDSEMHNLANLRIVRSRGIDSWGYRITGGEDA